ncbi:MAG: aminotransferase class I/II-fold pyridoxal phosphate-dependent enzyme [Nitrospiraceae bacterium]|nr:aminotransferase class I/II-fold pyridoxal phosphate-dependent enzyme [Nitrospiraceae bacterium]
MSELALFGGAPVRAAAKAWPTWPVHDDRERTALNEVLDSRKWWYGERVGQFERDYAAFQRAGHCVTCSSGTAALEIALQVLNVEHGDEVIVPPYTFIATASAVMRMGGIPVFVDVDESWCINPDLIEEAITPRTKAIMPVHFGGRICDMDRINAIADEHGLAVLEDACHSWGSQWRDKGTGALSRGGVFSFQASKNLTAAEGGAIVTDDEAFADSCRAVSNCGRMKGSAWYAHSVVGTNSRLTEFAAALLSAQLTRLDEQTQLRERNGAILEEGLDAVDGIVAQPGDERMTRRAYHLYCIRIEPDVFGCSREKFIEAANAEGLPIGAGYELPLYKQDAFTQATRADYSSYHCPVTEDLCRRSGMWLTHALLLGSEADMRDIVDIFAKIRANVSELAE